MKKRGKYSAKKRKKEAKEPMVRFHKPILNFLLGMSYDDLHKTKLPGRSLGEIQEQTSLSATDLAQVMGISKSKYYNLLDQDYLELESIDAMVDFATLWQKGLDAFDDNVVYLNEWLSTRNENIGWRKPTEILATRIGRRELEKAFLRIEYSIYG